MRTSLKKIWLEEYKDLLSYNTFRKYVDENIDKFKDVMFIKQNAQRKTIRILDRDTFIKKFKQLY